MEKGAEVELSRRGIPVAVILSVADRARLSARKRRDVLERYLDEVVRVAYPVLPYDEAAADWHARERPRLERAGRPPAWVDGEIAATAVVAGAVLVTANPRDFRRFRGVRVRDWLER